MHNPETPNVPQGAGVGRGAGGTLEQAFVAPQDSGRQQALQYVLKSGDAFIVSDQLGDIFGASDGFFVRDTRVLSELRLTFGGRPASLLSGSVSRDNTRFTAHSTNHPLPPLGAPEAPEGVIHLERTRVLNGSTLSESIALTNYGAAETVVPLSIFFGSDFHDIFEVRGTPRARRGTMSPMRLEKDAVSLEYIGLDQVKRDVRISFNPAPLRLQEGRADFSIELAAAACVSVYMTVCAEDQASQACPAAVMPPDRAEIRAALLEQRHAMRERRVGSARLSSNDPLFNAWLGRSSADLSLLTTDLPTGPYPYAGIPWFSTPFGRDAVITSLQTLWLRPALTRGVLRYLAAHQAHEESAFRDASVGKIMHETRQGEMAATGEVPFALYYGGVDTTPLFVVLAGAYLRRTGDLALIEELWPALELATQWVERVCDRSPFGLLDYQRGADSGLANQGWKDSQDSVFHADGRFPVGPIALVEVQAYACAAFEAMAGLWQARQDHSPTDSADPAGEAAQSRARPQAAHYAARAAALRQRVEDLYWMPELGFYGIALDGEGALCRVLASNAGHLLAFGLPSAERGAAVARQLQSSLFDSGWGIRTLAGSQARYNPMSYHNGSVWPHDTALCARGLAAYGDRGGAVRLLQALFEAAINFEMRLPELFCGFTRRRGEPPTPYPVACLPQAWAACAPFMILEACLGITIDAPMRRVLIQSPALPKGIDRLEVADLPVGDGSVSLTFVRTGEQLAVAVERADRVSVVVE